jgi:Domain of unknown function (DUF4329)
MDRSSLLNLKESLLSRSNGIHEKKQEFFEEFRRDGAPLGAYPKLLTDKEWNADQHKVFLTGVGHRLSDAEAYKRLLPTSLGQVMPDVRGQAGRDQTAAGNLQSEWEGLSYYGGGLKNPDLIDTSFIPSQRKGKKGAEPLPTAPPPIKPRIGRLGDAGVGASGQRQPPVHGRPVFKTPLEAAIAALQAINATSISEDREYAGRVCRQWDGKFIYTTPRPGDKDSSNHGSCPSNTTVSGGYHTHGAPDPLNGEYRFNKFSVGDIRIANMEGVPEYMSSPDGRIKVYDPAIERVTPRGNRRDASDAGHFISQRAPTR